ncbi:MAG: hypothetical protein ABJD11_07330 [Gemmatimonadota bacterium]
MAPARLPEGGLAPSHGGPNRGVLPAGFRAEQEIPERLGDYTSGLFSPA